MNLIGAFTPFIAFALVDRLVGPVTGVLAGTAVAVGRLLYEGVVRRRQPRLLDAGSAFLFAAMTAFWLVAHPAWTPWNVRLVSDLGLLALVVGSIAIGHPFTLPYIREHVDPAQWETPAFAAMNAVVSRAWAAALATFVFADALMAYTGADRRIGVALIVAALLAALKFTQWYPRHRRRAFDSMMSG